MKATARAARASSRVATALSKHSILIAGHRTSVSLEGAFWERLGQVAAARRCSIAALVAEIDQGRGAANLSSAIRVFLLETFAGGSEWPAAGPQ